MINLKSDMVLNVWDKLYKQFRDGNMFNRARIREKYYDNGKHYQLTLVVDIYDMRMGSAKNISIDSNDIKIR